MVYAVSPIPEVSTVTTETRAVEIRIEKDAERRGPGVLSGVLLTYGERASDRQETFIQGALHWPEGGVVLREQHNRQAPITRFVPEVKGDQVRVSIPLPDTARARDAAVLIRNGTFKGLSVEFVSEAEGVSNGVREIRRASLMGVGLVDSPSYKGSGVSVRHRAGRRRLWL